MRPSSDEYFLRMAELVATRGTCSRRQVGAVAVNKFNHVIATGYNGTPMDFPHCVDVPCPGAHYPSGEGLDACQAIHAEQNMLLQCHDVMAIKTVYSTTAPCITCIKMLLNTSCINVVFRENYPHNASRTMWEDAGRLWHQLEDADDN